MVTLDLGRVGVVQEAVEDGRPDRGQSLVPLAASGPPVDLRPISAQSSRIKHGLRRLQTKKRVVAGTTQ